MNKELKDLQFLGFIGIYKESFKLIFTCHKIFTNITLALIFPSSCIILANNAFSTFILTKITLDLSTLDTSQVGSTIHDNIISNKIHKEWFLYWLANIIYLVFLIIFFLFSVSAVVYTVGSIYTNKEITFKKVLSVVPKVWKRIMVTFLCMLFVIFVSTFVFVLVILIISAIIFSIIDHNKSSNNYLLVWFGVAFVIGVYFLVMVYMSFVWQLAYVISVLEKCSGFKAMAKSKALIKGKMVTSLVIYLLLGVFSIPTHLLVKQIKENYSYGSSYKVGECIWYGILSLVWMTLLSLFNLVVQTVLYFVCKSYHHEDIDKSSLADHLEVYSGEYVPLTSNSIQLQGFNV